MIHTAESLQAAFHYLFPDEVPALKQLAQSLPDNPIVINIGAGAGTSGLTFIESRVDLHLVTIDIQDEGSPLGCLQAERDIFSERDIPIFRYTQICADSVVIGKEWLNTGKSQVDMVFVDGEHSYEGCKGDILAWLPNIKPGGIIAIHDYRKEDLFSSDEDFQPDKPHPKPWPGVSQAVNELLLDKYHLITKVDSLIAFRVHNV